MSSDYPTDWDRRRKNVYERDNYQCQNCGARGGSKGPTELHAHHIVPKSKGGTHQRSNLISVCVDCHNAIHGNTDAPTGSSLNPSISSEDELILSVLDIFQSVSESEVRSNDAMDRLLVQLDAFVTGEGFDIDEYSAIRYEIIKQAFNVKEKIEQYESSTRGYLSSDVKTDIDTYVDTAWDSIQGKIEIIGHSDDLLMEFADREIECIGCGEVLDPSAKFCKNCGREIQITPECSSCGVEIEEEVNFCSNCGQEIIQNLESDSQLAVDEDNVEEHVAEIRDEIEPAINQALFVQILEEKFETIWIDNHKITWQYCPNCGLERGVVNNYAEASCVLCEGRWEKKGILNRYWVATNVQHIGGNLTDPEVDWERIGRENNERKIYRNKIAEID